MILKYLLVFIAGGLLIACSVPENKQNSRQIEEEDVDYNRPGKTFNLSESDNEAIVLADQVMTAMGGRKAWDETRFLSWNFFGARKLLWDRMTGDVRIDFLKQDMKILMNVKNMEGRVLKNGIEMNQPDSLSKYLERGKGIWINDSYWLVMPFKLKDSGVTLKYTREDTTLIGMPSSVLTLTFQEVGNTPNNKYEVWVDQESKLVTQWAFYKNFEDTVSGFIRPWGNYQKRGNIFLSDDRGDRDLTEVKVWEKMVEGAFTTFTEPIL